MAKICPKCGYERKPGDVSPDYECPKCGVIYSKFETERKVYRERDEHDLGNVVAIKEKSLPLAIGLNLFLPGAGYIYMGKWVVGVLACLLIISIMITTGLLFITPTWIGLNVIMIIDMMILSNKNKKKVLAITTKKCPNCAETIKREARICRFCNTKFDF